MSRLGGFLHGVTVIDLSRHLPGPLATLLLAELGARVIKVEPPAGDELRFVLAESGEPSVYFRALSAGKELLTMDLKSQAGRTEFESLILAGDVLVDSFRPDTMARLGFAPERMRALNPGLIYCSMSGFGHNGPFRDRAAHDINYLALSGALDAITPPGERPGVPWPPPADISAGLMATIAILAALHGRKADAKGCVLDLALADTVWPQLIFSLADLAQGESKSGARALLGGEAACYGVYKVRDGWVTLGALEPKFWERFCTAAGRADWTGRHQEPMPQTALQGELQELFAAMTLDEACQRFEPADCCFAPVVEFAQGVRSAHAQARGLLRPDMAGLIHALFPVRVDDEPPAMRSEAKKFEGL
jgi:alpha-methylacyl-CoA racemase